MGLKNKGGNGKRTVLALSVGVVAVITILYVIMWALIWWGGSGTMFNSVFKYSHIISLAVAGIGLAASIYFLDIEMHTVFLMFLLYVVSVSVMMAIFQGIHKNATTDASYWISSLTIGMPIALIFGLYYTEKQYGLI